MATPNIVVGVAGAGKTAFALQVIEQKLREGLKWHEVGFASFSRAACAEAASRAAAITGVDAETLRVDGHFRTLHSFAFRGLGLDSKVIIDHDAKSGQEFVSECCGVPRGGDAGTLGAKIDAALSYWDNCRARLSRLTEQPVSTSHSPPTQDKTQYLTGQTENEACSFTPVTDKVCEITRCHSSAVPVFFDFSDEKASKIGVSEKGSQSIHRDSEIVSFLNNYSESMRELKNPVKVGATAYIKDPLCREYKGNFEKFTETMQGVKLHTTLVCSNIANHRDTRIFIGENGNIEQVCDSVDLQIPEAFQHIIRQYEDAKRISGRMDFTDILMQFAGFQVDSDLMFRKSWPLGTVPSGIEVLMLDEYQDCSLLLDKVAERLRMASGDAWMLGDAYQAVYGFSGSDHRIFASWEKEAHENEKVVLLNKSYRNPTCVLKWGESVLSEDKEYVSRQPYSDKTGGSVGMMTSRALMDILPDLVHEDTMILCRAWFGLKDVQKRLADLCIPWDSCQEQRRSPWDCPVAIAITITLQDLMAGKMISEQDWRRLTENFTMKADGLELFKRGEKARWKKMKCSQTNDIRLTHVAQYGAGDGFTEFVMQERWRKNQYLMLAAAIEKWGIDVVRTPKIRIGSCHSVKGMQARHVFCLSTSTLKANESSFHEDLFLKYVTITRASENYRVVVDLTEHSKGRPMFMPCPKGMWKFDNDFRISHPVADREMDKLPERDVVREIPRDSLLSERSTGPDLLLPREVHSDGDQDRRRQDVTDSGTPDQEDQNSWWDFGGGSKFG